MKREYIAEVVANAALSISPAAAWLLIRFEKRGDLDIPVIAARYDVEADRLEAAMRELLAAGLIEDRSSPEARPARSITPAGHDALARMVTARRDHLARVIAEWEPEKQTEMAASLRRFTRDLVPDAAS